MSKDENNKIPFRRRLTLFIWATKIAFKCSPSYVVMNIISSVFALGLVPIISAIIYKEYISSIERMLNGNNYINRLIIALISQFLVNLVVMGLSTIQNNIEEIYRTKVENQIKKDVFSKVFHSELSEFESEEYYNKYANLLASTGQIAQSILYIISFFGIVIGLLSIMGTILIYVPEVLIIITVFQIPSFFIKVSESDINWGMIISETKENRIINYIFNLMTSKNSVREFKIFNAFNYYKEKMNSLMRKLYKENSTRLAKNRMKLLIGQIASLFGIILGYFAIIYRMLNGKIDLAITVMLFSLISQISSYIGGAVSYSSEIFSIGMKLSFLYDYLHKSNLVVDESGQTTNELDNIESIRFENVSYKYPSSSEYVLNDINIVLSRGQKIALVGENGSGKTTLIKLVLGLYKPTKGNIYINDMNITELSNSTKTKLFSTMFQDFCLYYISIAENISFNEEYNAEDINTCLLKASLYEIIAGYQNGITENLGTPFGGIDLSKGQSQSLGLARCFYGEKKCIVFDEPTAALDAKAEHEFFKKCMQDKDKMILYITHRLSTVKSMDQIFVLKNGFIIEHGTHEELLQLNGSAYKELFETQQKLYL